MSHSKRQNRGKSYYLVVVNPRAQQYLVACSGCGHVGFVPGVLEPGFDITSERKQIKKSVMATHSVLHLNEAGVCGQCQAAFAD